MKYKDFYKHLLTEGRNEDLALQKLKKNNQEDVFEDLKRIDKSKNNKHLPKLVDYYLEEKNLQTLEYYYTRFVNNTKLSSKDINTWKTFRDFENAIDSTATPITKSVGEIDVDPIYEDDNIKVFHGDSKEKCIKLSNGYTFCIGRRDGSNMYNSYRFNQGTTFYFIRFKDKKEDLNSAKKYVDENHYIVIQKTHDGELLVTRANNSGDELTTEEKLLEEYPEIKVLFDKNIIKPQDYSDKEKLILNRIKDKKFENLKSEDDKILWLEYYVGEKIKDQAFFSSSDDVKKVYIETREIDITDVQLEWLKNNKPKFYNRYWAIKLNHFKIKDESKETKFSNHELESIIYLNQEKNFLHNEIFKSFYKFKNGEDLNEYEYYNLPDNFRREYSQKKYSIKKEVSDFEFLDLSKEQKIEYYTKLLWDDDKVLSDNVINQMDYKILPDYAYKKYVTGKRLSELEFEYLPDKVKPEYYNKILNSGKYLSNREFYSLPDNMKSDYVVEKNKAGKMLTDDEFYNLPKKDDIIKKYYENLIHNGQRLTTDQFSNIPYHLQRDYYEKMINLGMGLDRISFSYLPEDLKEDYVVKLYKKYDSNINALSEYEIPYLPKSIRLSSVNEMKYKDFYSHLLNESYMGNCVDLGNLDDNSEVSDDMIDDEGNDRSSDYEIDWFGVDSNDGVEWMLRVLGDESNIIRIPEEIFYLYIDKKDVPPEASGGTDLEYYYVKNGRGFPLGGTVEFCLYSTNGRGDDIHYFFYSHEEIDIGNIKKYEGKLENGYGAGKMMGES